MTDMPELRTRYTFLVGAAYDDLIPAFVIDGRDYPDPAAVQADLREAGDLLNANRVVAEQVAEVDPGTSRPSLPSWPEFRDRHVVDGRFDESVPRRTEFRRPRGWDQLWADLERDRETLRDQLLGAARATVPGSEPFVKYDRGPARHGSASPNLAEEVYGARVAVGARVGDEEPAQVLARGVAVLGGMAWNVGPVRRDGRYLVADAERNGYEIHVLAADGGGAITFSGKTPLLRATEEGSARVTAPRE